MHPELLPPANDRSCSSFELASSAARSKIKGKSGRTLRASKSGHSSEADKRTSSDLQYETSNSYTPKLHGHWAWWPLYNLYMVGFPND